jgi:hypothetical protein
MQLIKNAIRIDSTSGVAHLYAGQLQAALGKRLDAEVSIARRNCSPAIRVRPKRSGCCACSTHDRLLPGRHSGTHA